MGNKWVHFGCIVAVSGLISFLISTLYARETRKRLEWYVDGKVAAK